jgi:hypothetical protein
MDRQEIIEILKLLASGQALPGTIIKQWLWVNEGKFNRCITIAGHKVAREYFRDFVNSVGGVHYVFKPGTKPYIPKGPSWFPSDYISYSKDDRGWKDDLDDSDPIIISKVSLGPQANGIGRH